MQITFDRKTVNTCLQQKFVLPTYQRDYKWTVKHLQELLTDIQEAFLSTWKPNHGRQDVLGYDSYFLGTIITTQVAQGGKAIVDGQQRITTLTLLLSYVHRLNKKQPNLSISPVDQTIRRRVAGQNEFNLDMDKPRHDLFDLLIDGPTDDDELSAAVDSIQNKDSGTERLWSLYQEIDNFLAAEIKDQNLLPHLFDYLTECVCMFEIGVPREQDGHKVFVTMNDRGLKLSPIDLLKGFLLSSISNNQQNQAAHASWMDCIQKLKGLGSDEDSNFFKTWIRSKYADTIRGKKRGDAPGDFELIGDSYHRWVIDNKDRLGLKTSDDFSNLLTGTLPYFVNLYCQIKHGEQKYDENFPHVFFNGARDLTLQAMVIFSTVKPTDTTSDATKKIKAISYFLDYLATVRVLNGKENTYDNIRDLIFELAKEIRDLDVAELKVKLSERIQNERDKVDGITGATYENIKRQDLLHLLGRLAEYLERSLEMATGVGFSDYVDRSRDSRTFDVEHLIAHDFADANADIAKARGKPFSSTSEFTAKRNSIGGLILLPRGRNRSMKDMAYTDKLQRYSGENVLAQTLTENFFKNQPNWTKFSTESGIKCDPVPCADISGLDQRTEFYRQLASKIWCKEELERLF
ncbi:DUF262 domain-containing protein [Noviherbaspirillum autotrophicum]|uniref:GmrSD restriction endonucleases N-terminal domain-containing protein n=1 Tax=Noviherbaspirillum autotrophicum TaxID=709839 RepID=A0A0C2BP38_9BURK|nr:DUF262 domain-containing protein [Noviherbaspirillum autotrophicum]KIF81809.1 hypothetical protein TSA66_15015 [Noviherbaspirillum autotrophicum]